jgi:hypothetical protein
VQRPVAALGEHLVGPDHHHRIVVLHRDLEVVEVVLLEERRLPHGGLDQRLRRRLAVLRQQARVERAGVDPDPDGDPGFLGGLGDLPHLVVELADVPGVDPDAGAPGVDRGEDVLRLEVDVSDDGDLGLVRNCGQSIRVVLAGARHPDDVAACRRELGDLLQGGVDVGGERRRHRLHADGRVPSHEHLADPDLTGRAPRREDGGRQCGQSEVDGHTISIALGNGHLSRR